MRLADDWYRTPNWCVRAILPHLVRGPVIDPCCGDGAVLNVVRETWGVELRGIEIDRERSEAASRCGHLVLHSDAFIDHWPDRFNVITNPPFSLAMKFVQRAVGMGVQAAFLLRLGFLESAERAAFHKAHPCDLYALSQRPSYCASITCSTKKGGCGWHITQDLDAARPRQCPSCGRDKLTVTTSDSSAYGWFVWGPGRGGRLLVLDKDATEERNGR